MLDFKKNKKYQYLIVNIDTQNYENITLLKETIDDYFTDSTIDIKDNNIIVFYYEEIIVKELYDVIESLSLELGEKVRFFKGNVVNGYNYSEFNKIYELYLRYLKKSFSSSNVCELVIYMLINDIESLREVREFLIGYILKDDQLVKLVLALTNNNLNVSKTASSMYMHRNTINNKLEQIRNETGFDIQNFNDVVAVYSLIKYL